MQNVQNILADIPEQLPQELFTSLISNEQLEIKRIVSRGHANKNDEWYDQAHDEWLILLQGEATLEFAGQAEIKKLRAGDYMLIPAHSKHRVAWTAPDIDSIWLVVNFESIPGT